MDSRAPLLTEPDAIRALVGELLPYADADSWVSIRAFDQHDNRAAPIIEAVRVGSVAALAARAAEAARRAAEHPRPTVFCPPVATFASAGSAAMANMANGLAISVDADTADPREALRVLSGMRGLGPPTLVVNTGSVWMDPRTDELVPKAHFHWRLSAPTTTPAEHDRLCGARRLAAALVGADRGLAPPVRSIRWPGSLSRKAAPTLAIIEAIDATREVGLDEALDALREAMEAANRERDRAFADRLDRAGPVSALTASTEDRVARALDALECVPNADLPRAEWVRVAHALFAATGGAREARAAFLAWSAKSKKHTRAGTFDDSAVADTLSWRTRNALSCGDPVWDHPPSRARRDNAPKEI